ncbi:hypothetical protein [Rummeliibacillus suwonensis]|uniref:hypothetical protein n=1 Tax=Rummeliibacillus suwonensis TaxID=1306154 RepID=UPI002897797F|nr:hypothetical protein [Rummeliibacillus suwonensis]
MIKLNFGMPMKPFGKNPVNDLMADDDTHNRSYVANKNENHVSGHDCPFAFLSLSTKKCQPK